MENKEKEKNVIGTLYLTNEEIYKREGKFGVFYTNGKEKGKGGVFLNENTKIYGTDKKLTEKEVKKLINGELVLMKLYSKTKEKEYEGLIRIKGINETYGTFDFDLSFPSSANTKLPTNND